MPIEIIAAIVASGIIVMVALVGFVQNRFRQIYIMGERISRAEEEVRLCREENRRMDAKLDSQSEGLAVMQAILERIERRIDRRLPDDFDGR